MKEAMTLSFHTITMKTNRTRLNNWVQIGNKSFFLEMIAVLSIPISFCGLVGNATVFWLLCSKVKKTTFITYFLNMIAADFIVAAYYVIMYFVFVTSYNLDYHFSRALENMYLLSSHASKLFLTVMCFERYIMVFFPLYYQQHRPKVSTMKVCGIIWFWSFLQALITYVTCYLLLFSINFSGSLCNGTLIFRNIVQLVLFVPIMSFSALKLFIRRVKQRIESRLDITLIIIVVLSLICIFTFRILNFLSFWVILFHGMYAYQLAMLFESIMICISPLIYFFVGNRQKEKDTEPMYKLLERALSEKESTDTVNIS